MESFAEKKLKGGKLVSVRISYEDRIESVKVLGDFFLYPEESLKKIERSLVGLSATASKEEITRLINRVLTDEHAEFIGMTPEAIAETICDAVKK